MCPSSALLQLWKFKNVVLCSSRYALEVARINLADEDQRTRLTKLSRVAPLFEAAQRALPRGLPLPEKDVPILRAAIEARATHLLTGDLRHFGPYVGKKIEVTVIALPGEYVRGRAREN
jgi:uncharacterized protein